MAAAAKGLQRFQSQALGFAMLIALLIVGNAEVSGFTAGFNVRSMLVLTSLLGVAALGQTFCALVGGLDLSIPFVISAANIILVWLMGRGISPELACVIVLVAAAGVGLVNGLISRVVNAHSLIVTLGTGFVVLGGAQIITAIGTTETGSEFVTPPQWLTKMSSVGGNTFGIGVPSVVLVWLIMALLALACLRLTSFGRGLYALGSNRAAAERALVSEPRTWLTVFSISGLAAGTAGILLVGFSGGGVVQVGEPYLFTTIAAVVIGGTSLLGGKGGYGLTMLGAAILVVLQTLLAGIGLSPPGQQAVLGALIILMLGFYAREPHPSTQV